MPADIVLKAANTAHRALLRLSGGRVGRKIDRMPVLELVTVGRRSGKARAVLLTAPARDGAALVVVASKGGDERHPDWFLNLRAQPRVEVALQGGPREPRLARIAEGPVRERLWARIAADYPRYAAYQHRTAREIPVVVLVPVG